MEIWKDVKNYEGCYQVSDLGRIRSLDREVNHNWGGKCIKKGKVLTPKSGGKDYLIVSLSKNNRSRTRTVHQLVAIAFKGHTPCGYKLVVNHKDLDTFNNKASNLEIVTSRKNTDRKHLKSTSKYVGVYWIKDRSHWCASIVSNGKQKYLGSYKKEIDAHESYQKALKEL